MIPFRIILSVVWSSLLVGSSFGQVTKITDPDAFSEEAIFLSFSEFHFGDGIPNAADLYSVLGITFQGELSSQPVLETILLVNSIPPVGDSVIRNRPSTASSADQALVVKFEHALRKVGVTLGNGSEETIARIRALTASGELLGEIEQDGIDPKRGPFIGVETAHPSGISTLVLDYGESERAETINDISLEFMSKPVFRTYLPQVGDGEVEGLTVQTLITATSLFSRTTQVQMLLFDQQGQSMDLTLNGQTANAFDFTLIPDTSMQFESSGLSIPVRVGYACIESDFPVSAHAVYQTFNEDGQLIAEAGISGEEEKSAVRAIVGTDLNEHLNMGLAIANTNAVDTFVRFGLRDQSPDLENQDVHVTGFTLPAGHQRSFFLSDLFAVLEEADLFSGSAEITSEQPITITILRTISGIATSSLPIASTQPNNKIHFPESDEN